jgi:serine/threonine-protein kinase/endoribonuclease IRE1
MRSVMAHPVWWPPQQKLAFLISVSDRVEGEDRAVSTLRCAVLRCAVLLCCAA